MIIKSIEYLRYRFESRINKTEDGCWIWNGSKNNSGYGQIRHYDKTIAAHRLSMYFYKDFDLDSNLFVLHKIECNNKSCVRPEHLYTGTRSDNTNDTVRVGTHQEARKTHCPQGHEYSMENTYYYKDKNNRVCRICGYYAKKRSREKNKGG